MGRLAAERKHGNSRHAGMSERELRKILVVEDDPDIRRVAETALTGSRGFSVRTCSSGREALVAAPEFQPELVLLDLTMPAMDGPETLAELRKDQRIAGVPVAFMARGVEPGERARCLALGAIDVIATPVDAALFAEAIGALLSAHPRKDESKVRDGAGASSQRTQVDQVWRQYAAKLPERLHSVGEGCRAAAAGTLAPEALSALRREVHRLAGSGTVFGFPVVTSAAQRLDAVLSGLGDSQDELDPDRAQKLVELARAIELAGESAPHAPGAAKMIAPSRRPMGGGPLIDVVGDDEALGLSLALQFGLFGCTARLTRTAGELIEAMKEQVPAAVVVVDGGLPEEELGGTRLLQEVNQETRRRIPVVFISRRADLRARLEAVRAGADAYLTKPLDVGVLVEKLDELIGKSVLLSYRVLLVGEPDLASAHAAALQAGGLETRIAAGASEVSDLLAEFRPDVILIESSLEGFSARELAWSLRQDEENAGIPILLPPAEAGAARQRETHHGGLEVVGNEIGTGPIMEIVVSHAERSRLSRDHLVRDERTGLLNHTAVLSRLEVELARADRVGATVALCVIDIDDFKKLNDRHGSAAGDRVLKTLSRFLMQNLRRTDHVGRYGGEKLVLVLQETSAENASFVVDAIRRRVRMIRHTSVGGEGFSVSFSAGIAAAPPANDTGQLIDMAGGALALAKARGKDRVEIAAETSENSKG
jgi:diguanylate cyclase (GGDEF)-like protein